MRFEDLDSEIPGLAREWDSWFLDPDSLDSFLALEGGVANEIMLDSIASVGMSSWVDVQRSLGANAAYGVQLAGGVADAFIEAGEAQWNIGQGGVVAGVFGGLQDSGALEQALGAFEGDGVDADALAAALGKAALGVALGVVSVAVPVVGAVAGLIAGAVSLIVREYRKAETTDFAVPQNYLPASGATAATCTSGSANAADQIMMRVIRKQIPAFAAVAGTRGIPSTSAELELAAGLTELTQIFLPDVIPSGRTSPELSWIPNLKDASLEPGLDKHPRAPEDLYFPGPLQKGTPKPGELYTVEDECTNTRRKFIRVGVARELGSMGVGWVPGRGAFSGPEYWVGVRGAQRGAAAGGPGVDGSGRDLPWPHEKIGLESNVKAASGSGWVSAAQLFPSSSAFMASLERQVMSAPGCFLVSPLEILLFWREWQSGFQELAERFLWEGAQLPRSFNRLYFAERGPATPGADRNFISSGRNTIIFDDGENVAELYSWPFFAQAAAWKVMRNGRWVVESSVALPWRKIQHDDATGVKWEDGNPRQNWSIAGQRIPWTREMVIPDRIYAFRDPKGLISDKGSTGYYGPVVDLVVEPWANSVREMQMWALKTLQVAYITQNSPAIQKDSMLRGELQNRREQLLNHEARFQVELLDVLDNVGPDSYFAALKSRGVGKLGAGSLAFGPATSGAELEPGDEMPSPDIPEPIPPGFVAMPKTPGAAGWPLVLGAAGGLAALGALLRR